MDTKETKQPRPRTSSKGNPAVRSRKPAPGRQVAARKKRSAASASKPTADVVYTQPGPFNRNRFLLHLASIVAVVFALLFGMSIFFKVETVTVAGTNKYTQWDVYEASGIQTGENLLTISEAKISSNIRAKLPYVDTVRVGIKLPNTVKIEIVELDVVYAVEADDGNWWLMRADGGVVEQVASADADHYTKVVGVKITQPEVGKPAQPSQPVSEETMPDGTPVPVTVNAAQQLETAISILQYLEENGVIGDAAVVDVTNLTDLQLWWKEQRFQVLFGDATQLSYKIKLVKTAIDGYMETYDSGVLDVSMTIQPDPGTEYQVIYTPFE